MSSEELLEKLQYEKRRRRNAECREVRLRNKITQGMKEFNKEDDSDFNILFKRVDKSSQSEEMLLFWEEQAKAIMQKDNRGRRWHPKVIRMSLSIWNRSPEAYHELRESGMMKLPSGRLLQMYKNSCSQKAGLNNDVGKWMAHEASKQTIGKEGREGGIILDEMSIQEDLQMKSVDGVWKLVGLVELGDEYNNMHTILNEDDIAEVATHVMQFVFLGNTGFRFPFAHFPTREADPASIYVNFWKAVGWLDLYGFNATFCCCDGGQANRSFIQMDFKGKDAIEDNFTTVNPYTRKPMVFILDPSHNFKKIRNNLEKSRIGGVRLLTVGCDHIEWAHLYQAYRWDQNSNSLKIHEELTEDHFNLGYVTRMRNHLAEQVLSKKMLYLLQVKCMCGPKKYIHYPIATTYARIPKFLPCNYYNFLASL